MAKARDKKQTGTEFVDRILAKVPEAQRAAVAAALQVDEVVAEVGEAVLMKDDYSRLAGEAAEAKSKYDTLHDANEKWWQEKSPELYALRQEVAQLKTRGGQPSGDGDPEPAPPAKPAPAALPPDVLRRQDLDAFGNTAAHYMRTMIQVAARYQSEWGEPLDIAALETHCARVQRAVDQGGYDSFVEDKVKDRAEKRQKEREEKIRLEERQKVLQEMAGGPPSLGVDTGMPSFAEGTLAGLTPKDGKPDPGKYGVEAAVRGFNQRRAAKGA